MIGKNITKLIIVCNEKTKIYANYLRQLISSKDDKEGKIIGTEDGTVDVAVWLEKEYLANEATISSNEHILFIGKNNVSKSEIPSMKVMFNRLGMKYGWLGKRAMMIVDEKILNKKEQAEFIALCHMYEDKLTKDILDVKSDNTNENKEVKKETTEKELKKKNSPLEVGAVIALGLLTPIAAVGVEVVKGITNITENQKVKDQQYKALTAILYVDGLKDFLEG